MYIHLCTAPPLRWIVAHVPDVLLPAVPLGQQALAIPLQCGMETESSFLWSLVLVEVPWLVDLVHC